MQHPHEVDIVKAVLGAQKIVVYGEDLLRHSVADGESTRATVAEIGVPGVNSSKCTVRCKRL